MNTAELIVGGLCGMVIALLIVWIYIAHTKMDLILEHLKNSSAGTKLAALKHGGVWGRLLLVGGASGLVTFANFYIRRGTLSTEDVNNFPGPLKQKLVLVQWSAIGLLSAMTVLVAVGKSG
ncbi:hypothetical protein C1Y08_13085 [Pseudomonas sp. FW306-02-F02-AA]|uniref:Uncharacterized protein n=1 Tax=Pseudomonas fluorescens TaxID=294 RepID=A0A0N7H087_PSEFL|nr:MULTISPECIES: hypothetical protein [Pseudomonas]ALI02452.1 hypothetical protein AO353_15715 [Pseudomonas fluorescens]PMZ03722.1 hypothetical protein C1Y07_12635 [Pseudomonas sp. FW306-02-F02-AB]PMZ10427.1 hypothetical protein C1Y06_08775 [Pseudomonas sp. FW306-02-H06C]PMZ15567.1 hypothetical protein C1Y08_13085 [Pseudomonas sp. FW306-02-F02-AA]PMZ22661.1 hypothetical protein C1Y09_06125 [Pseudomonas sp. FW306-02-F08-AA]